MLEIVIAVLYTVVIIVALLLIGLVLIQQSKSSGIGATFGGVGESVFGAQAVNHLSKLTVILTAVFFILTLLLTALSGRRADENRKVKAMNNQLLLDAAKAEAKHINDGKIDHKNAPKEVNHNSKKITAKAAHDNK